MVIPNIPLSENRDNFLFSNTTIKFETTLKFKCSGVNDDLQVENTEATEAVKKKLEPLVRSSRS